MLEKKLAFLIPAKCFIRHAVPMEESHQEAEHIFIRPIFQEQVAQDGFGLTWEALVLIGRCQVLFSTIPNDVSEQHLIDRRFVSEM